MTTAAWYSLDAEYDRLRAEIEALAAGAPETPDGIVRLPVEHASRRLDALALALAGAERDDDPTRVAIGRRVVFRIVRIIEVHEPAVS